MLARMLCGLLLPSFAALAVSPAAAVTIDGWFDPTEGYAFHATISPNATLEPVDPADAWFYQDPISKDVSVAIILPLNYTDNTYGALSTEFDHTHQTWYSGSGGSMGNSDLAHTFKDLEKSDHAAFQVSGNGSTSSFGIDYLYLVSKKGTSYDSGPATEGGGDPNGVLVASATSIDFNVNTYTPIGSDGPFTGDGTGVSPELADPGDTGSYATLNDYTTQHAAGWIMENVYEFTIDGDSDEIGGQDVIDESGFINGFALIFADLHASPSKKNTAGAFENTEPNFNPIPEPDPAGLVGVGLLALAAHRQAQRRIARSR